MVIPHAPLIWVFAVTGLWQAIKYWLRPSIVPGFAAVALMSIAAGFAMGDQAKPGRCLLGATPLQIEWLGSSAMAVGLLSAAGFFVSAAYGRRRAVRLVRAAAMVAAPAVIAMAVAALFSNCQMRVFDLTNRLSLTFLSLEKLYLLPVWLGVLVATVLYARKLDRGWPRAGVVVCALGTVANVTAQVIYTIQLGLYWGGVKPPWSLIVSGRWLNYTGQLLFLAGLCLYAGIVHLRSLRLAIAAADDVRVLWPLHRAFVHRDAVRAAGGYSMWSSYWLFTPLTSFVELRYRLVVELRDSVAAARQRTEAKIPQAGKTSSAGATSGDTEHGDIERGDDGFAAEVRLWREQARIWRATGVRPAPAAAQASNESGTSGGGEAV